MDFGSLRAIQAILEGYINLTSPDKFYADDISQNCKNYMRTLEDQHDRRPFISAQGYVGLAPAHLQPGDAICILYGATVPFVLRELPDGQYQLIGEAYVRGIMDGEWLETERKSQTFLLC
jgi:hypothetical protein